MFNTMVNKIFKINKEEFEKQRIFLDDDYRFNLFMRYKNNKEFNVYNERN